MRSKRIVSPCVTMRAVSYLFLRERRSDVGPSS
eukprot:CAMPEP_0175972680 /NCGR_PEP_ID=MMETSP0108-20121206/42367_1 /TAXON_ID=195067 ORGANISM="Goniomonas pacifica, Strain CCMP1869" /NCGR_SAMPLE_ID=MMETSP0108 /ASSEMBLY_ACC=CAM_ASM_000204 /LENGTH=32 /DNA_ID= /DNA_START= /DNA_END= /DNA_ORIENTATION=